jgi:prefoldin alpha subunit
MSNNDGEDFRRLAVELQILEGTAESMQQRLSFVNAALRELTYTRMTLEGIEKEQSDASVLVPIGGGSFIRAKLEATDKIIVGMGAGVSIEKTIVEAKEIVQNRISEMEKSRVEMQKQLVQIVNKIQEDRTLLNEMLAKQGETGKKTDVPEA